MSEPRKADRLDFVDLLRGVAVVLMILWHTVDAWLTDAARGTTNHDTVSFGVLRLLGGMAAPLFVMLAGTSLALKTEADQRKGVLRADGLRGSIARGLEVMTLGYLLRMQFWVIDAAGFLRPHGWAVIVLCVGGLLAVWWGTKLLGPKPRRAGPWIVAGLVADACGILILSHVDPFRVVSVLRIDVLQTIGASLVVLAPAAPWLSRRPWVAIGIGVAICLATPWVTAAMPGPLPGPVAGYLGRWDLPKGARPITLFPLFPWLAFACIGVALGSLWSDAARRGALARTLAIHAAIGLGLAIVFNETLAYGLHWLQHVPKVTSLVRILARVGTGIVFGWISFLCLRPAVLAFPSRAMRAMGRRSMMVYWVHLELAFGVIADPIKKTFGLWQWAIGWVLLTGLMYLLVLLREGPFERWVARLRAAR